MGPPPPVPLAGAIADGLALPVAVPPEAGPASDVPHSPQKRVLAAFAVPQLGQVAASLAPHSPQNFRPGSLVAPQLAQVIW
jgi:hypothetical protein